MRGVCTWYTARESSQIKFEDMDVGIVFRSGGKNIFVEQNGASVVDECMEKLSMGLFTYCRGLFDIVESPTSA